MERLAIKVIKRRALADVAGVIPAKRVRVRPTTVTTTVNDWIAESRLNKLNSDISSRETIAGWAIEPII